MVRKILVLDKAGFSPVFVEKLESGLDCTVEVTKDGSYARKCLESNGINLAIVNPYVEQGGIVESNVDFVKNDLKEKQIPIVIFSRAKSETIAQRTGLALGVDYQAYLRKPAQLDEFVNCVMGLLK